MFDFDAPAESESAANDARPVDLWALAVEIAAAVLTASRPAGMAPYGDAPVRAALDVLVRRGVRFGKGGGE